MKKIILSNEEEANEELMWQPRTKATAATAGARGADCCAVTGVTLSKSTLELKVNETHTLKATVAPDNATDSSVRWSSSKESVATVSASGLVCAKKEGTATITVETNDGGFTASCEVTVKPATVKATGIELEKTSMTMQVNDTGFLTACVTPSNATNQKIIWSSCSPDVASVNSSGLVCAKQAGVVKITAKTEDGGFSRTCVVTVTPNIVAVTGVRISHTTLELETNESRQLTANTLPSNATNKKIDWTSSDESVATVRTSGLVCAKKAGTTIITASCEEYSATCILTVIEGGVPVTGVELSQTSLSIEVDSSYLLQAEVFPDNATNKAVTWCSCSSDVATVSEKGLIQAKTTGSVKITATTEDGNFSETCWVTIVPKGTLEQVPVESVSITSQEETYHLVKMGETLSLNASVMPASATNKEVVWLSEDASVATVDTNGVIHPRSEGEVRITATSVAGGKTAEYWVKVIPAVFVEDLLIDLAYKSGNTYQFAATTVPATATGALVWTSSDPSILSIDDNGVGTRLKDGAVTITATAKTTLRQVAQFEEEKNEGVDDTDWGGAIGWFVLTFIVPFGFLLTLSGCSSEQGDTVTPTHTFETESPYEKPGPGGTLDGDSDGDIITGEPSDLQSVPLTDLVVSDSILTSTNSISISTNGAIVQWEIEFTPDVTSAENPIIVETMSRAYLKLRTNGETSGLVKITASTEENSVSCEAVVLEQPRGCDTGIVKKDVAIRTGPGLDYDVTQSITKDVKGVVRTMGFVINNIGEKWHYIVLEANQNLMGFVSAQDLSVQPIYLDIAQLSDEKYKWSFREIIGYDLNTFIPTYQDSENGRDLVEADISELNVVLHEYGINTQNRICHFLAQCYVESGGGFLPVERFNGDDPIEYFRKYETEGNHFGNRVNSGDGAKYRGAGAIQITGRDAYTDFSQYVLDEKILNDGAVYVGQNYFWESSAYFWSIYKPSDGFYLNKNCDEGASVATITRIVTGKENVESLPEREEAYNHYSNIIHIS